MVLHIENITIETTSFEIIILLVGIVLISVLLYLLPLRVKIIFFDLLINLKSIFKKE